jgi:hypothetical protein
MSCAEPVDPLNLPAQPRKRGPNQDPTLPTCQREYLRREGLSDRAQRYRLGRPFAVRIF